MAGRMVFITGGARSGKSAFAEALAAAHSGPVAYVPTAPVCDAEMEWRVALHQGRRPADWTTVECEGTLAETIRQAAEGNLCILVDCLTVYLARLLPADLPPDRPVSRDALEALDERAEADLDALEQACRGCGSDVILVTNEVGSGLVPSYPSGRLFRDLVGRANRRLAAQADYAYFMAAGVALDLKALRASRMPWGDAP